MSNELTNFESEYNITQFNNINEKDLPNIIAKQVDKISVLSKKIDKSKQTAEDARNSAKKAKSISAGIFHRKEAIEAIQESEDNLAQAVIEQSESQQMLFEMQTELANATRYLFGLGVSNIANNRSVVRQLQLTLKNASEEELTELARQEIENVIRQLKAQEDTENKVNNLSNIVKKHEGTLKTQESQIFDLYDSVNENKKQSEKQNKNVITQGKIIEKQSVNIAEHDLTIKQLIRENDEQDIQINKNTEINEKQELAIEQLSQENDEQDKLINRNTEINEKQELAIEQLSQENDEQDKQINRNTEINKKQELAIEQLSQENDEQDKQISRNTEINEKQEVAIEQLSKENDEQDKQISRNTEINEKQEVAIERLSTENNEQNKKIIEILSINGQHEESITNILKTIDEQDNTLTTINEKVSELFELFNQDKLKIQKLKNILIILITVTGITLLTSIITLIQNFI